ncbi:cadherin-related family member 3 [Spea bombifrons]|uniref:cadherin-related family member 3 n=1 Tax=Spea bombifrons TaxID=233779 RepID=UPI00234B5B31|nr:cadherin-related family member 3 [Spea bombifrons]
MMEKLKLLYFLLGVIGPGGGTVLLVGLPNSASVMENQSAGTSIFSFSVSTNSTISSGFPYIINTSPLTKAFRIDYIGTSYNVALTGSPLLDFETTPNSFNLQIYVEDSTGATDLQILTVQLTNVNEPPMFLDNLANQDVSLYIIEGNSPGAIYQVLASDRESATNTLRYSLVPASAPFSINTGTISSTKVFDYETDPHSYSLIVTVTDPQGLSVNGSITVYITNINDETPYFTTTTLTYLIPEEQIPGTTVANITAVDPDADNFINTLLYSINTPTEYFTIDQLTGGIQIAKTIDREADPFRLHPNIVLEVMVKDRPSGGQANSTFITFIIQDINDNPPMCQQYAFRKLVPETETTGTLIIDLTNFCSDIDVDSPYNLFNFTGLSGLGSSERFQLSPSGSGKIVLIGNLDFEDPNNIAVGNEYSLTVAVQDIAAQYFKKYLYVYVKTSPVNEFPPVFNSSSYVFNISELSPATTKVGQVYATDKDYPYIGITYSIVAGGSTFGSSDIFWMDPNTGNLQLATKADYEITSKYIITVQAEDSESKFSTASVTVNILEANDEKPICVPNSYTLSIPVDQAIGTNIQNFKLTCTDRDSGPNSFRYFINSGNINNHFAFTPTSGSNITNLVLAVPFDYSSGYDTTWNYNLRVYITDDNIISASGGSKGVVQTGTVSLNIKVYIPGLTTIKTTTTPEVIYQSKTENSYSAVAWYIPFVITLGSVILLGLLGYLTYLFAKHCPCRSSPKPDKELLIKPAEKTKIKHDVFWEMTKINTVFDGEAQDPITGKIYEYNSKSGARRWKDTQLPVESEQILPQPAMNPNVLPTEKDQHMMPKGTPNKREKTPIGAENGGNQTNPSKPATPNRLQTANQTSPKLEPGKQSPIKRAHSPLSPRLSPKVAPKTPIGPT